VTKYQGKYQVVLKTASHKKGCLWFEFVAVGRPKARVEMILWQKLTAEPNSMWHYEVTHGQYNSELLEHTKQHLNRFCEVIHLMDMWVPGGLALIHKWWSWEGLVNVLPNVDPRALFRRLQAMKEYMEPMSDWPPDKHEFREAALHAIPESVRRDIFGHDGNVPTCECEYCEITNRSARSAA
jgi:hypothetical protein